MRTRRASWRAISTAILLIAAAAGASCSGPRPGESAASSPLVTDTDVAAAIEFRESIGLRSDEAFVRAVAVDPAAIGSDRWGFGFPLLPSEVRQLEARPVVPDAVANVVEAYGERFPEEWAGLHVDSLSRGPIVGRFTGRLTDHLRELLKRLSPDAAFRLEPARWSLGDLTRLAERIDANASWFEALRVAFDGADVDVVANVVRVKLNTDRTEVIALALEHFAAPADMLVVDISGRRPWDGGHGQLTVEVTDAAGAPFTHGECFVESENPAVSFQDDRGSGMDGLCFFLSVPATKVRISIFDERDGVLLAVAHAIVQAADGTQVKVQIEQ